MKQDLKVLEISTAKYATTAQIEKLTEQDKLLKQNVQIDFDHF